MEEDRSLGTSETSAGAPRGGAEKTWTRQEAQHFQDELLKKGESLLREQKGTLATVLNGIANVMGKSALHFEEEGQPNTARYTRQAAQSVHDFARNLRERDLETLKKQVTDLARRQPGLIAGGAVALGFLAARFLKSSAGPAERENPEERFRQREESLVGSGTELNEEEEYLI